MMKLIVNKRRIADTGAKKYPDFNSSISTAMKHKRKVSQLVNDLEKVQEAL